MSCAAARRRRAVTTDGDDIVLAVRAIGRDGEPVLPEPLPVESPLIKPIENGVRLVGCAPWSSRTPANEPSHRRLVAGRLLAP